VGELLERIVRREPYDTGEGKTGSRLERVWLDDGTELILKHETADNLLARVLDGSAGRVATLWEAGVLTRLPTPLDAATVAVERDGEGSLVFMRDVARWLVPEGTSIGRDDHRRVVDAVHRFHETFRGEHVDGLCPLADRFCALSAASVAPYVDSGDFLPPLVTRGWEHWPDAVPADVCAAVLAVHDDPEPLATRLLDRECTLVHGDLRLANLGLGPERTYLLDWGALSAVAPAAMEWLEYLAIDAQCVDASHDEFLADIAIAEGRRHDPEALSLAILGQLAMLGWNKALDLFEGDDRVRARQRVDLDWWIGRVRQGLEVWSPI
jgi:hypothetical protein